MGCILLGTLIHIAILPFLDLTLSACNATLGIIFAMILARTFLGERFIWQYDLVAIVFIAAGCITIVLNANKNEVIYTEQESLV